MQTLVAATMQREIAKHVRQGAAEKALATERTRKGRRLTARRSPLTSQLYKLARLGASGRAVRKGCARQAGREHHARSGAGPRERVEEVVK
jgi:hypothetical protein